MRSTKDEKYSITKFAIRLDRIVTYDKKCILYDNQRRSIQWMDADESTRHMPKPSLHPKRTMVTVWWSSTITFYRNFHRWKILYWNQKIRETQHALSNESGLFSCRQLARFTIGSAKVQQIRVWGQCLIHNLHQT